MSGYVRIMRRLLERLPERRASPRGIRCNKLVEHDDTFDHVGDYRRKRSVFHGHRDDAARRCVAESTQCAIDTHDARRTPKPWCHET